MATYGGECEKCRGPREKNWTPDCNFRPCAQAKGITYCFECNEFPCSL